MKTTILLYKVLAKRKIFFDFFLSSWFQHTSCEAILLDLTTKKLQKSQQERNEEGRVGVLDFVMKSQGRSRRWKDFNFRERQLRSVQKGKWLKFWCEISQVGYPQEFSTTLKEAPRQDIENQEDIERVNGGPDKSCLTSTTLNDLLSCNSLKIQ